MVLSDFIFFGSRSPHTVMLETGRGIPQAVILQTVRIWIKRGESRGGGLREPALLEEAGQTKIDGFGESGESGIGESGNRDRRESYWHCQ